MTIDQFIKDQLADKPSITVFELFQFVEAWQAVKQAQDDACRLAPEVGR